MTHPVAPADHAVPAAGGGEYLGTTEVARILGLSVATVQSLVERGEIEAWKTQGGHRRILRRSVEEYQQRSNPAAAGGAPERRDRLQVLVVEDDEATRELYRELFEQWGMPVDLIVLDSAFEAMLDIANIHPHLLITDLNMPGVDGIEMLKVLKRSQQLANLHVLVASGLPDAAIAERGGVPEGAMVLRKPLNFDWLQGYVSALLANLRA